MKEKLRVFVSSVQRELEDERLIVQNLVNTDPFLSSHCIPVLYEYEPASPERAIEGCLLTLDTCHVYLLIVGFESGTNLGDITITHAEFRRAKEREHRVTPGDLPWPRRQPRPSPGARSPAPRNPGR